MKKLFAMVAIAGVFAACGNGENKTNAADSAKMDSAMHAVQDSSKSMLDSAKSMMDTARKMLDTASAKVSAVADSAKKALDQKK
jgi:hypothetical protein